MIPAMDALAILLLDMIDHRLPADPAECAKVINDLKSLLDDHLAALKS